VSGVVADTSVWVDFFAGDDVPLLADALAQTTVVLPPIVVAELASGARRRRDRAVIADLVRDLPLHETPVEHWLRVGELRRALRARGLSVSTPDAHVAQCALDRSALLLSRDAIFRRIAQYCTLRVAPG
jgi:predicted nucleic acid-binding protein